MIDLWPEDLGNVNIKAPVTILKEQASILGSKTKNIVTAQVSAAKPSPGDQDYFFYTFYLVAPALQNYRYRLFSIAHDVELYPVTIYVEGDLKRELAKYYTQKGTSKNSPNLDPAGEEERSKQKEAPLKIVVRNEDRLLEALRRVFQSQKSRLIIESLLAQSEGYRPNDGDLPF